MNPSNGQVKSRKALPRPNPNMLFTDDFRKLISVCLKMLFRKSTRKRFALLVMAFIFMMGFNTGSYVKKFHEAETQKKALLNEKAFKLFFLRMSTRSNCARFLARHYQKITDMGVVVMNKSFLYQNNLYAHFYPTPSAPQDDPDSDRVPMSLLNSVLGIEAVAGDFHAGGAATPYETKIRPVYIDHNGGRLDQDSLLVRDEALKNDLTDIADAIRGNLKGKRLEAFNVVKRRIIDRIERLPLGGRREPNPYLSRLQSIVPLNLLYVFSNIHDDNTTDIMDLPESVTLERDGALIVFKAYLEIPPPGPLKSIYGEIDEIYPRYLPLYIDDLLLPQWSWLLYQQISLKSEFMNYLDQLHFKGHYLFSYEKSHIIRDKVKKINTDIRANHIFFYLTDLSMGIIFPFMMSLFAFIHLKTEIAFLLMSKNRIREILSVFWLLPVILMLMIKGGVVGAYWFYLYAHDFDIYLTLVLPLLITLVSAAVIFYPVNRWCFSQFTGDTLNLYELHKGR